MYNHVRFTYRFIVELDDRPLFDYPCDRGTARAMISMLDRNVDLTFYEGEAVAGVKDVIWIPLKYKVVDGRAYKATLEVKYTPPRKSVTVCLEQGFPGQQVYIDTLLCDTVWSGVIRANLPTNGLPSSVFIETQGVVVTDGTGSTVCFDPDYALRGGETITLAPVDVYLGRNKNVHYHDILAVLTEIVPRSLVGYSPMSAAIDLYQDLITRAKLSVYSSQSLSLCHLADNTNNTNRSDVGLPLFLPLFIDNGRPRFGHLTAVRSHNKENEVT